VQAILLCVRGQSIGKMLTKIRIVRTSGEPVGFVHVILLRSIVMSFIYNIPFAGSLVWLINPLLIFREDRRCLHDMIADTTVIDA